MLRRLEGRSILVVEDQPLIALDIQQALEHAGASVTTTNTLRHALLLVEHDDLSGAVIDHALPDGDSSPLCALLRERSVPFMLYSGFTAFDGECEGAPHLTKPATDEQLVTMLEGLMSPASTAFQ
jgi:CheY-like chemotaxis protein